MTKAEIAAIYGVTLGTLPVLCSRHRHLAAPKADLSLLNLTLLGRIRLPLSDGVLKSLREATRSMGKASTARLVSELLDKIATDGFYKAVLDEEEAA